MPENNGLPPTNKGGVVNQNDIFKIVKAQLDAVDMILVTIVGDISKNPDVYKKKNVRRSVGTLLDAIEELNELFNEKSPLVALITRLETLKKMNDNAVYTAMYLRNYYVAMSGALNTLKMIVTMTLSIKDKQKVMVETEMLVGIIDRLAQMSKIAMDSGSMQRTFEAMTIEYQILTMMAGIAGVIRSIKVLFLAWKVVKLYKFFLLLNRLIKLIAMFNIRRIIKARIKSVIIFSFLSWMLKRIRDIVVTVIVIAVLLVVFLAVSPVLFLSIFVLLLLVKLLSKLANRIIKGDVFRGIVIVIQVLVLLTIITVILTGLVIMAGYVAAGVKPLFIMIGVIFAVVGLFALGAAGIGFLAQFLGPYIALGVIFIFFTVLTILMIVAVLNVLQSIKLNRAKILQNVRTVTVTASEIIMMVLGSANVVDVGEDKGFGAFLKKLLGSIAIYFLGAVLLIFTMISVLAILIIAVSLRLLQTLKLDPVKILVNVAIVMDTAQAVIDAAFNPRSPEQAKKEEGWGSFLKWGAKFVRGIASVIQALLTMIFLVFTLVSVIAILFIAAQLKLIQNLDLDPDKVMESVNLVMWTANQIIDSIFRPDPKKEDGSKKGFIRTLLETIGGNLIRIVSAIMSIAFLAITLVSICIVVMIADQLKSLQNLNLDSDAVMRTVHLVFDTCGYIRDIVFDRGEPPTAEKSTLGDVFKWLFPGLANIMEAMRTLGYVMLMMVSVGCVHKMAKMLKDLVDIDLPDDRVKEGVRIVMNAADVVIQSVLGNAAFVKSDKGDMKDMGKKLKSMTEMVGRLNDFATSLAEMTVIDMNIKGNVDMTLDNLISFINRIDSIEFKTKMDDLDKRIEQVMKVNDIFAQFAKIGQSDMSGFNEAVDTYSSFITKVDNSNLKKLQTTANIFQQMAAFSKTIRGNFEGLADSLNTSIAPLLEELRDLIQKLPESIEGGAQQIGRTITLTSTEERGLLTRDMARTLEGNLNPGLSETEIIKLVEERMKNQSKMQIRSIEARFQELINLLKGSDGSQRGIPVITV